MIVRGANYKETFQYLSFHTPIGGMVKGAHRNMMRKMVQSKPADIEEDFKERVLPGINYCQRVGNTMGATSLLSLASTIDNGRFDTAKRIGCFSYGSGCCSEFYSGIVTAEGQQRLKKYGIEEKLNNRYRMTMDEYESLLMGSGAVKFGARNIKLDLDLIPGAMSACNGQQRLFLMEIKEFHRKQVAVMNCQTIKVRIQEPFCYLQFYRPDANNTINDAMVKECHEVLAVCDKESIKVVVLEGLPETFCFGADFGGMHAQMSTDQPPENDPGLLYDLWLKLATGPYVTVSHVRGAANAGGVGFVAASDVVIVDQSAKFSLSELLFGLFPACVMPFLIRRIGFQRAHCCASICSG